MTTEGSGAFHAVIEQEEVEAVPSAPVEGGPMGVGHLSIELGPETLLDGALLIDECVGVTLRFGCLRRRRRDGPSDRHDGRQGDNPEFS